MKRLMLSAILAIAATGAHAATVTNGSFEDGFSNTNAPWETVNPGQTNLDGWTVVHRNIDHVRDQRDAKHVPAVEPHLPGDLVFRK